MKLIECGFAQAEEAMNGLGAQGWRLVSCWPSGTKLMAALERCSDPASPQVQSLPAPIAETPALENSADSPDLQTILDACLSHAPAKEGFPHGISVPSLAKSFGLTPAQMLVHLRSLGLKSKDDDAKKYRIIHNGHAIWLKQAEKIKTWFVNATPMKGKSEG